MISKENVKHLLLVWSMGILFVLTRGNLINSGYGEIFVFDPWVILTVCLYRCYGIKTAATFAVIQGFLLDIYSCSIHGLFALIYLIVAGSIFVASKFFDLRNITGQVSIVGLSMISKDLSFFFMSAIFLSGPYNPEHLAYDSIPSMVFTILVTPVFFNIFALPRTANR